MKRINCPHCGKPDCQVQAEDGGITVICSSTGKVNEYVSRGVFSTKDKKGQVRGK